MTLEQVVSHLIAFLVGAATVAAGSYLSNKHTDSRRKKESQKLETKKFEEVKEKMPELIKEMRDDLRMERNQFKREFYLLSKNLTYNLNKSHIHYYHEDHKDLESKLDILKNYGYIFETTETNIRKFRMTEKFVSHVKKS